MKKKFIYYRKKFSSLNNLIKIEIKFNNKFYKLTIKLQYNKVNSKTRSYFEYVNYYNK